MMLDGQVTFEVGLACTYLANDWQPRRLVWLQVVRSILLQDKSQLKRIDTYGLPVQSDRDKKS